MIIESILNLVFTVLKTLLSFISLPPMPEFISTTVNDFFNLIFSNLSMIGFFLPKDILTVGIPIILIIINFEKLLDLAKFIFSKIPMLNIRI